LPRENSFESIPPGGLHLDGEEDCPLGDIATPEIRCVGPMRYSLDLGISDGARSGPMG